MPRDVLAVLFVLGAGASASSCVQSKESAEFPRANQVVQEFYSWSSTLTEGGERIAALMFDAIEGKTPDTTRAREALAELKANCERKLREMNGPSGRPSFQAFSEWHRVVTEYLAWECSMQGFDGLLGIVDDPTLSVEEKSTRFMALARSADAAEAKRKTELELATEKLYSFMNSRR